ncbi:hypothetical protein BST81_13235 [Leptolyngbya sp. 'hensonii']|uniref:hypothetical protein n=1 Tax=Leptolyngbya sp. 'hensonii' TaxID=1922337 RepID=UPI0009501D48|nr:hypothetical protein [Leptolyngbya sp. 'hensonii']OLP18000.1 hypothetical protein BST81_13235 [Leptolyngbya sp. 'hensonii']
MNLNVALTLLLLTLMCGAGVISAAYGFAIGREALRGITQPDIRPVNTMAGRRTSLPRRQEVILLKEQDIIKSVKTQIQGSDKTSDENGSRNKSLSGKVNPDKPASDSQAGLPLSSSDRGVTLEVTSVRQRGDSLQLDVKLQNDGEQPVRLLYSSLSVTDDQGRVLSANTEGLPTELSPQSKAISGTINISAASLENTAKLSIALTDDPNQQLQLQISGIPVVR